MMAVMPERKSSTVLSWPIARELAVRAKCDPRTIQKAATGQWGKGEHAVRARRVVADYFDLNPQQRPSFWKRPPEKPLPYQTALEIAKALGVGEEDVQCAARGLPIYDVEADKASDVYKHVESYFAAHPNERPSGVGSTQGARA